jgi:hypothetical protein
MIKTSPKPLWEKQFDEKFTIIEVARLDGQAYIHAISVAPEYLENLKSFIRLQCSKAQSEQQKIIKKKVQAVIDDVFACKFGTKNRVELIQKLEALKK